jgi:hypothetical protein
MRKVVLKEACNALIKFFLSAKNKKAGGHLTYRQWEEIMRRYCENKTAASSRGY